MGKNKFLKHINPEQIINAFPYLKEERTQTFAMVVFSLIAMSFFGVFAISPTLSTIAQLRKQIDDSQFVERQLDQKIQNIQILQNLYTQLQPDLPYVTNALPTAPTIPLLIAQINKLAQQNDVQVSSLQTQAVELTKIQNAQTPFNAYTVTFALSGDYTHLTDFLKQYAQFERIVGIDSLALSPDQTKANALNLNITSTVYFKD